MEKAGQTPKRKEQIYMVVTMTSPTRKERQLPFTPVDDTNMYILYTI